MKRMIEKTNEWNPYGTNKKHKHVLFEFKQAHNPGFTLDSVFTLGATIVDIEQGSRKYWIVADDREIPLYKYAILYVDTRITDDGEHTREIFITESDDLTALVDLATKLANNNQHVPYEEYHAC